MRAQAAMDADPGGLWRDVEPSRDVGIGLVGDDAQLDGPALAVRELGERRGQVVVEAVEPGWVDGGGGPRSSCSWSRLRAERSSACRRTDAASTCRAIPNSQGAIVPSS